MTKRTAGGGHEKRRPASAPEPVPDPETLKLRILILTGDLLLHRGDAEEAQERYTQALALATTRKDGSEISEARVRLGRLHRYRSEGEKVDEHFRRAVEAAREADDKPRLGQACYELALGAYFRRAFPEAMEHLSAAVAAFEAGGLPAEAARSLVLIGTIHRREKAYAKAAQIYERALALHRGVCDEYQLGIAIGHVALLHFAQGERESGMRLLDESGQRLKAVGAEGEHRLLRSAADAVLVQASA